MPTEPIAPLTDVWLVSVVRTGEKRWLAQLRLDGTAEPYSVTIWPGPILEEHSGPANRAFQDYTYDLHRLLLRLQQGERFALPFRLRPRWPTPPDAPALTE